MARSSDAPHICIIAALTRNGIIGRGNDLPWKLPHDVRRFKEYTTGHSVVMGRLTYESVGRPLPNRRNIVLTRRDDWHPDGVEIAPNLTEALRLCEDEERVYIIGGAGVYADALPVTDRMYLTHIDAEIEGDAVFPWFDVRGWENNVLEMAPADEQNEYATSFVQYDRVLPKIRQPLG